jgi:hypothetical protein
MLAPRESLLPSGTIQPGPPACMVANNIMSKEFYTSEEIFRLDCGQPFLHIEPLTGLLLV